MKNRIFIVVAVLLCLLALLTVFAGCDIFSQRVIANYETRTYPVEGDFTKIEIDTRVTDVSFARSEDESCHVVCEEREDLRHTVKVEDGTLKIVLEGKKSFSFYTKDMTMVVYLPETEYGSLHVENSTGNVSVPSGYSFGDLKISLSTGNIHLNGVSAETIDLTASTGKITAEKVDCKETMTLSVSTGNVNLTDTTCKNLKSTGSTGNLTLKDVAATEGFDLERSTGNIRFDHSDAETITAKTSTGKVTGTLRSDKIFITHTSTGSIDVPETTSGGTCKITTSTGKIEIEIEK